MDFKEKYQQALERAKKGLPIDEVFPELKESEDERIRRFLYEFIKVCGWSEKQFPPREKCLAYLEKQKEHQPAEWSEEDKKMLLSAIEYVQTYPAHRQSVVTWLKFLPERFNLQPHWKPSEEQIDALEHFIRSWAESGTMSPQNPTLCAAKTLLNDLKKL